MFSNEHWIRILFGKILPGNWSIFFLLDYFFRNYSIPEDTDASLLYAPLNTENQFHLKLERELNSHTDIYLKIGYLNQNLLYNDLAFSGWQATAGLELSD